MAAGSFTPRRIRPEETVLNRRHGIDRRESRLIQRFDRKIVIYKNHRYKAGWAGNGAFWLFRRYNLDPDAPIVNPSGFVHYTHFVSTDIPYNEDADQTKVGLEMINDGAHWTAQD